MLRRKKGEVLTPWAQRADVIMRARGLTRSDVGLVWGGMTDQSVGAKFRGVTRLGWEEAVALANLLGQPLNELFPEDFAELVGERYFPLLTRDEIAPWLEGHLDVAKLPPERFADRPQLPTEWRNLPCFRFVVGDSLVTATGILGGDELHVKPLTDSEAQDIGVETPVVSLAPNGGVVIHNLMPAEGLLRRKPVPWNMKLEQKINEKLWLIGEVIGLTRKSWR